MIAGYVVMGVCAVSVVLAVLLRRRELAQEADTEAREWDRHWADIRELFDNEPIDEIGLRRSLRNHPAGKGRRP